MDEKKLPETTGVYFPRNENGQLESWAELARNGELLILLHQPDPDDSIVTMGTAALANARDDHGKKCFEYMNDFFVTLPQGRTQEHLSDEHMALLARKLKEIFAPPVDTQLRTLRMPVIRLFPDGNGKLSTIESTFLTILADRMKRTNGHLGTLEFANRAEGNEIIFPVLDVTTQDRTRKAERNIARLLGSGYQRKSDVPRHHVFDTRAFDPVYLLKMMQVEFPDEASTLESNDDFLSLIKDYECSATMALQIRRYKRSGLVEAFREEPGTAQLLDDFSTMFKLAVRGISHNQGTSIETPPIDPTVGR